MVRPSAVQHDIHNQVGSGPPANFHDSDTVRWCDRGEGEALDGGCHQQFGVRAVDEGYEIRRSVEQGSRRVVRKSRGHPHSARRRLVEVDRPAISLALDSPAPKHLGHRGRVMAKEVARGARLGGFETASGSRCEICALACRIQLWFCARTSALPTGPVAEEMVAEEIVTV